MVARAATDCVIFALCIVKRGLIGTRAVGKIPGGTDSEIDNIVYSIYCAQILKHHWRIAVNAPSWKTRTHVRQQEFVRLAGHDTCRKRQRYNERKK